VNNKVTALTTTQGTKPLSPQSLAGQPAVARSAAEVA
jgi:hypothetical protein